MVSSETGVSWTSVLFQGPPRVYSQGGRLVVKGRDGGCRCSTREKISLRRALSLVLSSRQSGVCEVSGVGGKWEGEVRNLC